VFRCHHCGRDNEIVEVDITVDLDPVLHRLDRIMEAVHNQGVIMGAIDDKLDEVKAGVTTLQTSASTLLTDQARVLVDLQAALAGTLTPDQATSFQGVIDNLAATAAALDAGTAALDAGDPVPPLTPPTP
jgi:hypothetical protein